jgi:hypothetical protein
MKTASIKSRWRTMASWHLAEPEGQVKKEGKDVELDGGRTRINIGGLVVSSSKPSARFGGFVLKTIGAGLVVWASKPSMVGL